MTFTKLSDRTIRDGLFLILIVFSVFYGCSSRENKFVEDENHTHFFLPKVTDDISADVLFCRKISKKSGKPLGTGNIFKIKKEASLTAIVELKNRPLIHNTDLMFHLDWIDSEGKSFFLKPIILTVKDTSTFLTSSISLDPEIRSPGIYNLRVYYFRELIAEKSFELINMLREDEDDIFAKIELGRKLNKSTNLLESVDSVFAIRRKSNVQSLITLSNLPVWDDETLTFSIEWVNPEGKTFFKKKFSVEPKAETIHLNSSVSVSPEKREPGQYQLILYHGRKQLASKRFSLYKK